MGNQSSVYIHLDKMDDSVFKPNHYQLKSHNERYSKCKYFLKATYKITYYVEFPRIASSTEFYIYFTKRTWTVVNFTYYPYSKSDIIDEVYCFYSVLRLDEPLVLGFKTRNNRIKYYRYMDLDFKTSTGLPANGFDEDDVLYNLRRENEKLNRKLTLYVGTGATHHINGIPGDERPKETYSGKFKWVFRKANIDSDFKGHRDGPWVLYTSNLFTLNSRKNKIDNSIIWDFNNKTFYAIYVYYTTDDETAVLVELVKDFNETIFIARKDKDGKCWERVYINKTAGHEFENELSKIKDNYTHNPHRGRCEPIQYRDPGPVDVEKCDLDKKTVPIPIPKGTPKIPPEESPVDLSTHSETPTPDSPETPRPFQPVKPEEHPPRLDLPPARTPERPQVQRKPFVEIDMSKTSGTTYGKDNNIIVSGINYYSKCDLFCYFTHSLKNKSTFTISSFISENAQKKITNITEFIETVKHVNIYYNRYNTKSPVMISITNDSANTKYYKDLIQSASTYPFSSLKNVDEKHFTDELITESDEVNKSLTYQLDKITNANKSVNYGFDDSISLSKQENKTHGFCTYIHKPIKNKSYKGFVLFNKNMFSGQSENGKQFPNVQNKNFKDFKVYALNSDENRLLITEINETSTLFFVKKGDEKGESWINISTKLNSHDLIRSKLFEIIYPLKNSLVVEIDQKNPDQNEETNYKLKMISNKMTSKGNFVKNKYEDAQPIELKNVIVSYSNKLTDFSSKMHTRFCYVSHQMLDPSDQSSIKKEIAGIRFFISNLKMRQPVEINFYENDNYAQNSKDPLFFYYPPQSGSHKIFVYFYDDDPRPLLVCYNGHTFRRLKGEDDSKWIRAGKVSCTESNDVLKILKSIYGTMGKKIILVKTGQIDKNISIKKDQRLNSFRKDSYSVKPDYKKEDASLKLPINDLVQGLVHDSSIYKMIDGLFNRSFDLINIYRTANGSSIKNILILEFINEGEKTHISRKDEDGHFWVRQTISGNIDNTYLSQIQYEITNYAIYEIDKIDPGFYNNVKLEKNFSGIPTGFTKYIHSPKNRGSKTTRILYKGDDIKEKVGSEFQNLRVLSNNKFSRLTVYFGSRARDGSNYLPVIIELRQVEYSREKDIYYSYKKDGNTYFWEQLTIIHSGGRFDLRYRLREEEFELIDSIVVLMDQTNQQYGDTQIKNAISNLYEPKRINLAGIDNNSIPVKKMNISCISKHGFTAYEHDISRIRGKNGLGIRFFMFKTGYDNNYVDLSLYSEDNDFEEYLYYDDSNKFVYVFFYGSDPRPILFCYGSTGYKPSVSYYDLDWFKINDRIDFKCDSRNNALLKELSKVVGLINIVNLNQIPENIPKTENPNVIRRNFYSYDIQIYNRHNIRINLSYENKSCYRCYTHTPMDTGHRLGMISYNHSSDIGIQYEWTRQLTHVSVYFNLFDIFHKYPLLVSLRYADGSYDYYELVNYSNYRWKFIEHNIEEGDIETKAYEILKNLNINFDRNKEDPTLFLRDECKEGGTKAAVIAGSVGGGVVGTAAVGGGVTVAVRPELIITSIRALV